MIEYLKVIIIGIVEGITEWLPVSSTGHMIIINELIKLNVSEEFWNMFLVVIQLGAILAVVVLFWNKIFPFNFKKGEPIIDKGKFITWFKVVVAMLPAAVIGIPLDDWMEEHLYNYIVVALTLIIYGIWFLFLEKKGKHEAYAINDVAEIGWKTAFGIGLFQVLSLVPGTSRSGSTIIGAMLLGTSRPVAAEFTFWLSIPVMLGASFLKVLKFGLDFTANELVILGLGCITAFVVSLASIKFLMNYVRNHDFRIFGVYRIILGILVILFFNIR